MFDADPRIMILLLAALAACLVAWRFSWRASRQRVDLLTWVRNNRPEAWQTVPGWARGFGLAVEERLLRGPLRDDPEFVRRYRALPSRHRVLVPLLVGILCIAIVGVGTKFFGWHW